MQISCELPDPHMVVKHTNMPCSSTHGCNAALNTRGPLERKKKQKETQKETHLRPGFEGCVYRVAVSIWRHCRNARSPPAVNTWLWGLFQQPTPVQSPQAVSGMFAFFRHLTFRRAGHHDDLIRRRRTPLPPPVTVVVFIHLRVIPVGANMRFIRHRIRAIALLPHSKSFGTRV